MNDDFKTDDDTQEEKFNLEEWAERKKAQKEALYSEINETAEEIVKDPDKFRQYLDIQSRNDRYSAANCLTLLKYCPEATRLREFDEWEGTARIKKGERGIPILKPYEYYKNDGTKGIDFVIRRMFDISQTTAEKAPAPAVNHNLSRLTAVMIDTAPVSIELVNELSYSDGGAFYNNEKQTLLIKRDAGDSAYVCRCVARELAHAQLSLNSESYDRKDMSFQAVCIGYMFCKKQGMDVKGFDISRIPEELKNKDAAGIRAELSQSQRALKEINFRVITELNRQEQKKNKEYER